MLGRRAIVDSTTAEIALVMLALLTRHRKIPEPVLILGAGIVGVIARGFST